jgi:transcriptional regulator with XRE-family HTH domain
MYVRGATMKNEMTVKVLKIIKDFIYNNHISLSEFARRAGVSKAWLCRLQTTDANLSVDTASKLLNAAGYELNISKKHSASRLKEAFEYEIVKKQSRLKKVAECQND